MCINILKKQVVIIAVESKQQNKIVNSSKIPVFTGSSELVTLMAKNVGMR
jgi:hypothetical protein